MIEERFRISRASIAPDALVQAMKQAYPQAEIIWEDRDEESFSLIAYGITDFTAFDKIIEPHIFLDLNF